MSFKGMPIKKKIFVVILVLFIMFVIFTVAAVKYTERPKFCITCHNMDPYYNSWKISKHNEVNCLECHYEPSLKAHVIGKIKGLIEVAQYLSGKYGYKPKAHVSDITCLREGCHERQKLSDKTILFKETVQFSHAKHFNKLNGMFELGCTSCHAQITDDEHMTIDKNTCYTCHLKNVEENAVQSECIMCHKVTVETPSHKEYLAEEGTGCLDCHDEAIKGKGQVRSQMCYFCHADKETISKASDKELLHKVHTFDKKVDCSHCHELIGHN